MAMESKNPIVAVTPRQLLMVFDSEELRDLSLAERHAVIKILAGLLLEASGLMEREDDDGIV
jgi:hypothetical protein